MYRRTFAAGAGIALSTFLGGCVSGNSDPGENSQDDGNGGEDDNGNNNDDKDDCENPGDTVSLDPPRDVLLENRHDEERTVTINLTTADEEIHSGEHDLAPDSKQRIEALIDKTGVYTLEASLEDGRTETLEIDVSSMTWDLIVGITPDDELMLTYTVEDQGNNDHLPEKGDSINGHIYNDDTEERTFDVMISVETSGKTVNDAFTVGPDSSMGIGTIGEVFEEYTVKVGVEQLDIEATETFEARAKGTVEIRLLEDETLEIYFLPID